MPGAGFDAVSNPGLDRANRVAIVEERNVLLPRDSHRDPEAVIGGQIEEPARRDRVGPNDIHAVLDHHGEVLGRDVRRAIAASIVAWAERPVRHALHEQLAITAIEELPLHHGAMSMQDLDDSGPAHPLSHAVSPPPTS